MNHSVDHSINQTHPKGSRTSQHNRRLPLQGRIAPYPTMAVASDSQSKTTVLDKQVGHFTLQRLILGVDPQNAVNIHSNILRVGQLNQYPQWQSRS